MRTVSGCAVPFANGVIEVSTESAPASMAAMDHDRDRVALLDRLHQVEGHPGREQARHVLHADGVDALLDQLVGERRELLGRVHRAHRVADGALGVLARRLHRPDRGDQVAGVVERVKDAEDVQAVLGRAPHERLDHVVREARVLHEVLAAQQHHLRRLRGRRLQGVQPGERVLGEVSQA